MVEIIQREAVYLWYYFDLQIRQILPYYALGIVLGSVISVFVKDHIHGLFRKMGSKKLGIIGVIPASILGIASPLCMYGTIPLAASFSKSGFRDDWLAAFMMSSIMLNPQLIIYSTALGSTALAVRILSSFLCGIVAGLMIRVFYKDKPFFIFSGFDEPKSKDTDPNLFIRLLKNIGRNIKATALWFFIGVVLSVLFQRYVPAEFISGLFGKNEGFGVLMAATIGVPLYACGGGTIPLLIQWLADGMSLGSASAFMITGPATKITNLGALKIVLGIKRFILYLAFVMLFSLATGLIVDLIY
ncbi:MAG: permease [Oscillospiraceae bacterium]|nr:permease [Oscillospiraceae bacterium]